MDKVKVCLFIKGFHNGGVEKVFENYFSVMDKSNLELHIVTHMKAYEPRKKKFEEMGFTVHEFSPIHITRLSPKNIREYKALFDQYQFDVIHNNFPEYILPLYFAKKNHVPLRILHTHNDYKMLTDLLNPVSRTLYRMIVNANRNKFSNLLIGCGETSFRHTFNANSKEVKNGSILNNAIDLSKFAFNEEVRTRIRNEHGIGHEYVMGHVGRYEDVGQKNTPFIIEVFEKYLSLDPSAKLLLIGEGKGRKYVKEMAEEKGIDKSVIFTGAVTNVNEYLQAMDAFIFPSLHEGLGIAAVEAQAAGLPCIISERVPTEACVTVHCFSDELSKGAEHWAKCFFEIGRNQNRADSQNDARMKAYDIHSCAEQLRNIYLDYAMYRN